MLNKNNIIIIVNRWMIIGRLKNSWQECQPEEDKGQREPSVREIEHDKRWGEVIKRQLVSYAKSHYNNNNNNNNNNTNTTTTNTNNSNANNNYNNNNIIIII
jgi:hypothetical protein